MFCQQNGDEILVGNPQVRWVSRNFNSSSTFFSGCCVFCTVFVQWFNSITVYKNMVKILGPINCYDVMVAMESPHPGISCLIYDAF